MKKDHKKVILKGLKRIRKNMNQIYSELNGMEKSAIKLDLHDFNDFDVEKSREYLDQLDDLLFNHELYSNRLEKA